MRPAKLEESVEIPNGVQVTISGNVVTVKGPKGEVSREFKSPKIKYEIKGNEVIFLADKPTKREKKIALTFRAHLRNMFKGVVTPHRYELKVCSGHFPMSVSVSGEQFIVKNFLGEKTARVLKLKKGATVKVEGDIVTIESVDVEKAGQIATDIEQLTRITNRDPRIFQDGVYIIKKPKEMAD